MHFACYTFVLKSWENDFLVSLRSKSGRTFRVTQGKKDFPKMQGRPLRCSFYGSGLAGFSSVLEHLDQEFFGPP